MSERDVTVDAAAREFVAGLKAVAYDGAIRITDDLFHNGPRGRLPAPDRKKVHEWYRALDSESQRIARSLVEDVAHSAVFQALTFLDGVAGTPVVAEMPCEIVLAFNVYADEDAFVAGRASGTVRVNSPLEAGGELHDLFNALLEQGSDHGSQ
jgi:hypothetical protein